MHIKPHVSKILMFQFKNLQFLTIVMSGLTLIIFVFIVGTSYSQTILVYEDPTYPSLLTSTFTTLGYSVVRKNVVTDTLTNADFVGIALFIDYVVETSTCPPNWSSSIPAIQTYMNSKKIVWVQFEHNGFHTCNAQKLSLYNSYLTVSVASSDTLSQNNPPYLVANTVTSDVSCILTTPNSIAGVSIATAAYNHLQNVPSLAAFALDGVNDVISAVFGNTYTVSAGYRLFFYTDVNNNFDSSDINVFSNILRFLLNGCGCNPATECNGYQCGTGVCGGNCGTCAATHYCDASHTCVCNTAIECNGYQCGTGACGGNCGTCAATHYCDASHTCVCNTAIECNGYQCGTGTCGGNCGTCAATDYCDASHTCVCNTAIQCNGYQCGTGTCGGNCGTCSATDYCDASHTCVCNTAIECNGYQCGTGVCGGNCGTCSAIDYCDASHTCVCNTAIECNGYQCGTGACGGSCGTCLQTDYCDSGNLCQPLITQPKLNDHWIMYKSACIKWDTSVNFGNVAAISVEYGTGFASSLMLNSAYYMPLGQYEWLPTNVVVPSLARIKFEYPSRIFYSETFYIDSITSTIQSVPSCY